jgi:hypothetical protein
MSALIGAGKSTQTWRVNQVFKCEHGMMNTMTEQLTLL